MTTGDGVRGSTGATSADAVRCAVIPAAGLGTRFLPATKVVPKELLPVVDRPALQYVVAEAAAAGLRDVLLVTSANKPAIEAHFRPVAHLEATLAASGDAAKLALVEEASLIADVSTVVQDAPRGLGHAVLCAADHVGPHPFAVLLGDDLIDEADLLLQRMLEVRAARGGSVVALMEVPPQDVSKYGCAAIEPTGEADVVTITGMVEKPAIEDAPSNLVVVGRYVLDPAVFDVLRATPPGRGGEIQLTDALEALAARGHDDAGGGVSGVVFTGRRYDTGDKLEYLKAVVQLALARDDVGPSFGAWLDEHVAGRRGAVSP
jgi:UTP--glucose-1-phosphate uridylyltransferase